MSRVIFLFRTLAFIERGGQYQILVEKKSGGESNKDEMGNINHLNLCQPRIGVFTPPTLHQYNLLFDPLSPDPLTLYPEVVFSLFQNNLISRVATSQKNI